MSNSILPWSASNDLWSRANRDLWLREIGARMAVSGENYKKLQCCTLQYMPCDNSSVLCMSFLSALASSWLLVYKFGILV